MKTTDAQLLKVGYNFATDVYIAVFRVGFHLTNDKDLLSEFPGYDELTDLADKQIDKWARQQMGKPVDLEESEVGNVNYELSAPTTPDSWGIVLWTVDLFYRPEALEDVATILNHWERAIRQVILISQESNKTIAWADETVLERTREA